MTDPYDATTLSEFESGVDEIDRNTPAWNILIADDDNAIHAVTKLVLSDVLFEGRPLNFISAYSGKQTREVLAKDQEIAIILLDVVMETTQSGLDIVRYLREERRNHRTRVILRTGQPGEAPERAIITEYDINDYKEKADLTSQRLFSCVLSALRSYRDIITIEQGKRGLERIIESSNLIFKANSSLSRFAKAVLDQISALLQSDKCFMYIRNSQFAALSSGDRFEIINGTPAFSNFLHRPIGPVSAERVERLVEGVLAERAGRVGEREYVAYFNSPTGFESVLYLEAKNGFSPLDRQIMDLFSRNITLAFENLSFNRELLDTQKELLFTIGDIVESHQPLGTGHLQRVSEFSVKLAQSAGLGEDDVDLLGNAVILHDMGMALVPPELITKPAPLDDAETAVMRRHAEAGRELLSKSRLRTIQVAGAVASQHHEHWDGSGYPRGLAGQDIHIFARICSIADAADSMAHDRPYRPAIDAALIRDYLADQRGRRFDPNLTDLVLADFAAYSDIILEDRRRPPAP